MKKEIYYIHSTHLDLFWMGSIEHCMDWGSKIIDDAVEDLARDGKKHFTVESVRFLEYYLCRYPHKKETVRRLLENGQLEAAACYTDRLENHYDGEALVRNVIYGKKLLKELTGMDTEIALHPDLPGLAEQTPQIYKKAGVKYYFFARGYEDGARFYWEALDGSRIIAYNFPKHYAYYNFDRVMRRIDEISKQIESDVILLSCSAGDLGDYNTFLDDTGNRVKLDDMMRRYNDDPNCPYELVMGNIPAVMKQMGDAELSVCSGESPCRWGTYGSATNVSSFKQDKQLASLLEDAGKTLALCELNRIDVSKFSTAHPFVDTENNRLIRRYFDAAIRPSSPAEWLDFAWRLQLITHDHNYAGREGSTSDFDRYIFKKSAIRICEELIQFCTKRIREKSGENTGFCVFNLLNWERAGEICLSDLFQGSGSHFSVKDRSGKIYSVFRRDDGVPFFNASIKSMDYEVFQFCDSVVEEEDPSCSIKTSGNKITLENPFYAVEIDTSISAVTGITDKTGGENLTGKRPTGIINAYEDLSVDVHEELYDRKLLDTTKKAAKAVQYGKDASCVWLCMETEICSSKVLLKVQLSNIRKEFTISPVIYWIGKKDVQLRFQMDLPEKYKTLFYGVPYGIQVFGNYIRDAFPAAGDEISRELFKEYREVQGWFAAEGEGRGVSVCTDQSSFAFKENREIEAVLIRNVKSCGDHEVYIPNHGEQKFYFTYTSYAGISAKGDDRFYRRSWELSRPFRVSAEKISPEGTDKSFHPLLQCGGEGILSSLDFEKGACFARFFSVSEKEAVVSVSRKDSGSVPVETDLLGNTIGTGMGLKFGEIKTVKF
ncbi:MAG: hypothetical protein LBF78_09230 [Treponema sp.]|jgi:hypothetical protein|nr:hypothetical protein [Treponema sp.]